MIYLGGRYACHMCLKDRCETELLLNLFQSALTIWHMRATLNEVLMEENDHETHVFFSPRD